jgi:hypothetical protein
MSKRIHSNARATSTQNHSGVGFTKDKRFLTEADREEIDNIILALREAKRATNATYTLTSIHKARRLLIAIRSKVSDRSLPHL